MSGLAAKYHHCAHEHSAGANRRNGEVERLCGSSVLFVGRSKVRYRVTGHKLFPRYVEKFAMRCAKKFA
jgi:hypothetical protein